MDKTTIRVKQHIVINNKLKMPKGKLAVQVSHASLNAYLLSTQNRDRRAYIKEWELQGT